MTANTADRPDLFDHDRSFYAELWGNTSRAARTRRAWDNARVRSRLLALVAFGLLVSYVAAGHVLDRPAANGTDARTDARPAASAIDVSSD